jgi:hypothetical protein
MDVIILYPNFYATVPRVKKKSVFENGKRVKLMNVFPVLVDFPESVGLEEGERAGGKTQKRSCSQPITGQQERGIKK